MLLLLSKPIMQGPRHSLQVLLACCKSQHALAASVEAAAAAAARSVATSAAAHLSSSRGGSGEAPDTQDSYYWIPPAPEDQPQAFTFDRRSIADRRATGRLESALEAVLMADGALREQLVLQYGFSIHRVQPSKDRRTVFILWDASPGKAQACQRALEKSAFRLRRDLAKVLAAKLTPRLEFRHDHLPPMQASAAAAMEEVEQELMTAAATTAVRRAQQRAEGAEAQERSGAELFDSAEVQQAAGGDAAAAAASSSFDQGDVDAAIARLEAVTDRRRPGL